MTGVAFLCARQKKFGLPESKYQRKRGENMGEQRKVGDIEYTLVVARGLIDSPEKWNKGSQMVIVNGTPVSYCALGAVAAVTNFSVDRRFKKSLVYLNAVLEDSTLLYSDYPSLAVTSFNDDPNTTHSDVLRIFDSAIELAHKVGV
jgi:hypothetical protein